MAPCAVRLRTHLSVGDGVLGLTPVISQVLLLGAIRGVR